MTDALREALLKLANDNEYEGPIYSPDVRAIARAALAAAPAPVAAVLHPLAHGTHTPCCGWPEEHKWADPIRCMKDHEDWPCAAARAAYAASGREEQK